MKRDLLGVSLAILLCGAVPSQIGAAAPTIVEAYPLGTNMSWSLSQEFVVDVWDGSAWVSANARSKAGLSVDSWYHEGLYPWVHWVTVGASDSVRVRVSRHPSATRVTTYNTVRLQPDRLGITPTNVTNTSFEFTALRGQKVYCSINDQDIDTLFVFVNPPKPTIPNPIPSDWLYFPPGWNFIDYNYQVPSNIKTIYLDGGAWVVGGLDLGATSGRVSILGPGFMIGTLLDPPSFFNPPGGPAMTDSQKEEYSMIHHKGTWSSASELVVDGPTLAAAPYYNIYVAPMQGRKSFRNVHILSPWWYNTDAFLLVSNAEISDCFVFNNDNKLTPEYCNWGDLSVKSCVLAGRCSFNIGYGYFNDAAGHHANLESIDLILQRGRQPFLAALDGDTSQVTIENQRYRDIKIRGDVYQLFHIKVENVPWMSGSGQYGKTRQLVFRDIELTGSWMNKSEIAGNSATSPPQIVECVFYNLTINGQKVDASNYQTYFDIDLNSAKVSFF